jgi:cobalt-zinc-cadmium efflux system membrane fusion protein
MTRDLRDCFFAAGLVLVAACGGDAPAEAAPAIPPGTVVLSPAQVSKAGIVTDTARVERVALPLSIAGTVVTPDPLTAHVGSIVEGRVEAVLVLPGEQVRAGAPLVEIDSRELATAQRDLTAAQAQLAYAQSAYDRSARLLAVEAVSKEEVERRLAQLDEARAELRRSREVLTHLSPSPEGDVVVVAPRSGTVFDVKVRPGEAVVAGSPLVDLGDASRLWVTGFVPENAAVGIAPKTLIQVSFDALPGTAVEGRVVRLGGMVDSLRRAVDVRVELARVPDGVRPGMFASLLIPAAAPVDRVVLPAEAVLRYASGDMVFIAEAPGTYHMKMVKAVALADGRMAVEGLPAGVEVVVRGAYALKSQLRGSPAGGE